MQSRRDFLKTASLTASAGFLLSKGLGAKASDSEKSSPGMWRMPDEDLPQERVFLAYAASSAVWKDFASDVNRTIAMLARTIAHYQPVTVFCREDQEDDAREACGTQNIDYFPLPLDDIWVRDYGGCFVRNAEGDLALVDFNFNGWGDKQHHGNDAQVARLLSEDLRIECINSRLTGEGGGIEVDGHGTAIMTESCWVNDNRNPGMTRTKIEAELKLRLGLRKIIWLPGIRGEDITDAHVDFYARFVRPGVVVANLDEDPESYDDDVTRKHLQILRSSTDADGRRLQVHILPPPTEIRSNIYTEDDSSFAAGYINYLPINGAVIAPQFGDKDADERCKRLLAALYPGRTVVQVNIDPIASGGGGIHCVTKNMPRA